MCLQWQLEPETITKRDLICNRSKCWVIANL